MTVPPYPPARLVISVPLDGDPYIEEDDGLADWLVYAAIDRICSQMDAAKAEEVTMTPNTEEDE